MIASKSVHHMSSFPNFCRRTSNPLHRTPVPGLRTSSPASCCASSYRHRPCLTLEPWGPRAQSPRKSGMPVSRQCDQIRRITKRRTVWRQYLVTLRAEKRKGKIELLREPISLVFVEGRNKHCTGIYRNSTLSTTSRDI